MGDTSTQEVRLKMLQQGNIKLYHEKKILDLDRYRVKVTAFGVTEKKS